MIYALVTVLSVALIIGGTAIIVVTVMGREATPPPVAPTIDVEALKVVAELITQTTSTTAKAIGEAVAASLVAPPVVESPSEVIQRVAHDMAEDIYKREGTVDDTDPTDSMIGVERADVAALSYDDASPFGVPGLRAVVPDLVEVTHLHGQNGGH